MAQLSRDERPHPATVWRWMCAFTALMVEYKYSCLRTYNLPRPRHRTTSTDADRCKMVRRTRNAISGEQLRRPPYPEHPSKRRRSIIVMLQNTPSENRNK